MSPQLHARCALAVLVAALLASAMGLLAWGPVSSGSQMDVGAASAGVASAVVGALCHAPGLVATWLGWRAAVKAPPGAWRDGWTSFWALAALAVVMSAAQHLAPSVLGEVLVRVPAASAYATVSLLFIAERFGRRWLSRSALTAALLAGPAAGLLCGLTHAITGTTDVRALLWLEALPLVLVPLGIWGLQSRGLTGFEWLVALALLCVSQSLHWIDLSHLSAPAAHAVVRGGHDFVLAAALAWLARGLGRQIHVQAPGPSPSGAGADAASQRSTSRRTSVR